MTKLREQFLGPITVIGAGSTTVDASGARIIDAADPVANTDLTTKQWVLANSLSAGRNVNTTFPLTGGGDLTADRTIAISAGGTANRALVTTDGSAVSWGQIADTMISGLSWSKLTGVPSLATISYVDGYFQTWGLPQVLNIHNYSGGHDIFMSGTDKLEFTDGYVQSDGTFHVYVNDGMDYLLTANHTIVAGSSHFWSNAVNSIIAGGYLNTLTDNQYSVIGGGWQNRITGPTGSGYYGHGYNVIAGGGNNSITSSAGSVIGGGYYSQITNSFGSFIGTSNSGNAITNSTNAFIGAGYGSGYITDSTSSFIGIISSSAYISGGSDLCFIGAGAGGTYISNSQRSFLAIGAAGNHISNSNDCFLAPGWNPYIEHSNMTFLGPSTNIYIKYADNCFIGTGQSGAYIDGTAGRIQYCFLGVADGGSFVPGPGIKASATPSHGAIVVSQQAQIVGGQYNFMGVGMGMAKISDSNYSFVGFAQNTTAISGSEYVFVGTASPGGSVSGSDGLFIGQLGSGTISSSPRTFVGIATQSYSISGNADSFIGIAEQGGGMSNSTYSFVGVGNYGAAISGSNFAFGGIISSANITNSSYSFIGVGTGGAGISSSYNSFIGVGDQRASITNNSHNSAIVSGYGGSNINNSTGALIGVGTDGASITNSSNSTIINAIQGSNILNSNNSMLGTVAQSYIDCTNNNGQYNAIVSGYYNNIKDSGASAILGGENNSVTRAQDSSVISGYNNIITGIDGNNTTYQSSILSGYQNTIGIAQYSSILGGEYNVITGFVNGPKPYNASANGYQNWLLGNTQASSILSGEYNSMVGVQDSVIVSGQNNHMGLTVSGSTYPSISGPTVTLNIGYNILLPSDVGRTIYIFDPSSGGSGNNGNFTITSVNVAANTIQYTNPSAVYETVYFYIDRGTYTAYCFMGGGAYNTILSNNPSQSIYYGAIVGGENNVISSTPNNSNYCSFIGGGQNNTVYGGSNNSVVGGQFNTIGSISPTYTNSGGYNSAILGGENNSIGANTDVSYSSIVCGEFNQINSGANNSTYNSLIGGDHNNITGCTSSFVTGSGNSALTSTGSSNITIAGSYNQVIYGNRDVISGGSYNKIGCAGGTANKGYSSLSSPPDMGIIDRRFTPTDSNTNLHWTLDETSSPWSNTGTSGTLNLTTLGSAVTSVPGVFGNAVKFNTSNAITTGDTSVGETPGNAMTVSFWVNLNSYTYGGVLLTKKYTSQSLGWGYPWSSVVVELNNGAMNGQWVADIKTTTGGSTLPANYDYIPLHTWNQIVITYDGNYLISYRNGIQVWQQHYVGGDIDWGSHGPWVAGATVSSGSVFQPIDGSIDDIRVESVVRTAKEIHNMYFAANRLYVNTQIPLPKNVTGYQLLINNATNQNNNGSFSVVAQDYPYQGCVAWDNAYGVADDSCVWVLTPGSVNDDSNTIANGNSNKIDTILVDNYYGSVSQNAIHCGQDNTIQNSTQTDIINGSGVTVVGSNNSSIINGTYGTTIRNSNFALIGTSGNTSNILQSNSSAIVSGHSANITGSNDSFIGGGEYGAIINSNVSSISTGNTNNIIEGNQSFIGGGNNNRIGTLGALSSSSNLVVATHSITTTDSNTGIYWTLNEGGSPWANTGSLGSLNLTKIGAASSATGLFGNGVSFTGGVITTGDTTVGEGRFFTISFWVYLKSYPVWSTMLEKKFSIQSSPRISPYYSIWIGLNGDGNGDWAASVTPENGSYTYCNAGTNIPLNKWTLITVTYDGNVVRTYVNDSNMTYTWVWPPSPTGISEINWGTHGPWTIGASIGSGSPIGPIDGYFDDVRIESVVRNQYYISDMYNAASELYLNTQTTFAGSVVGYNVTISGASKTSNNGTFAVTQQDVPSPGWVKFSNGSAFAGEQIFGWSISPPGSYSNNNFIGGGDNNTIDSFLITGSSGALIGSGHNNLIVGSDYATIINGESNTIGTGTPHGIASGKEASVRMAGQIVRSLGMFAAQADNQHASLIVNGFAASGAGFNLQNPLDGYVVLENNKIYDASVKIVVVSTTVPLKMARYSYDVLAHKVSGVVTIDDVTLISSALSGTPTPDWTITINNTGGVFNIRVNSSVQGQDRRAMATIEWRELSYFP